ncbi:hypothetical protein F2Q69_00025446 [Brassica cretica]|uniref:Secreted protein n=1 Tax=Brassica cretica TaxID=69181 RepID=A0A8S9Q8F1_BRACR|nr:hypothetical protein F2Q69_00025446 [Brassica cretica]
MWLVLSHGYVWGVSSLGVVARVLEVSVAARDETRDSIRISLFPISNDGTACLWTPLRAVGFYSLLQGLSRLSLRVLAATGVSVRSFLSLGPSTLRLLLSASRTIVCPPAAVVPLTVVGSSLVPFSLCSVDSFLISTRGGRSGVTATFGAKDRRRSRLHGWLVALSLRWRSYKRSVGTKAVGRRGLEPASILHLSIQIVRVLLQFFSELQRLTFLCHGYVWGVSSLGVVARVLEVYVAARDETRDSIRISLVVSVFRSWVLNCGSALVSLFSHTKSSSCGGVAYVCARHVPLLCVCGGLNGCIRSRDWRVGDSNLQFPISNDGTACQFLLVASRFEPPFSPGARGNRGLSPLIPFPWAIDATLTPVCL